jgi:cation diffusion facilitator CzcD-associated flavoprotein CzcO
MTGGHLPGRVPVLIVGAGFGGIAASVALQRLGVEHVLLDRAPDAGGTWQANTYPGCACDIPSHLYSLSFASNPDWSRSYAPQQEIWDYLRRVAREHGVLERTVFGCESTRAAWVEEEHAWRVETTQGAVLADVVVSAGGGLSEPSAPAIPGLDSFPGPVVHTARWPAGLDLSGRRVAVVGTGASAIQVVPAIAEEVEGLVVFQRTPAWILPRRDRVISARERAVFRKAPAAQRAARRAQWAVRELRCVAMTERTSLLEVSHREALRHLRHQVPDTALREVLTPGYAIGCKRILLSDDFYPAIAQPHVALVPAALDRVDGGTLVAADGSSHEAEVLVLATGFEVTEPASARVTFGADGRSLAEHWAGRPRAHRGTTVTGFPNLFLMTGPNTGLGASSMVLMLEAQAAYVADAVRQMRAWGWTRAEVRPEAQAAWNAWLEPRIARTVWATGGCTSWYQDAHGHVSALWPGTTRSFARALKRFDSESYAVSGRPAG